MRLPLTPQGVRDGKPAGQNGKAPPPDNYGAADIETQYRNCAEILFAAILREPHNFALYELLD